ncbi:hypothetical protein WR25_17694 [Diploscapter pachys]|uniref:Aminopeptidase N-like N-terminal domain-containing protein n=1 Tax=Diploscapter pachys TaxID=2018661 RepID=A0A2A2KN43_9BILA|nr:hypothetical protein WR25_17694 [Diploscapter pachys]
MGSPGPKPRNLAGPMGCTKRSAFISTVILVVAVLLTVLITYHFTKSAVQVCILGRHFEETRSLKLKMSILQAEYEDVHPLKAEEQKSGEIITAEELRLPNNIEPIHYNLTMKTYLPGYEVAPPATKNLTFEAQVIMTFKVAQTSRKIVVNFANLNIVHDECRVVVNNKPVKISRIEEIPKLEKLDFNLDESIEKDTMGELKARL